MANLLKSFPLHPIGIGTFMMGGDYDLATGLDSAVYGKEEECIAAIRFSLQQGQNHIDTAIKYGKGHTNEIVAEAIKGYDRTKIFIADKIPKTHLSIDLAEKTMQEILKSLKTDYVDLIYVHSMNTTIPVSEYIPVICSFVDKGYARALGLSNLTLEQLKEAQRHSTVPISAIEIQLNPLDRKQADPGLLKFARENDIAVVAYQPLQNRDFFNGLNDDRLKTIADKHQISPQQLSLCWLLSKGYYPIPKAVKTNHILENLKSLDIKLSVEDIKAIDELV